MQDIASPKPKYLKDYQPSSFEVSTVNLLVQLFEHEAVITCELNVKRANKSADVLVLNGEGLTLKSITLNNQILSSDKFTLTDTTLEVPVTDDEMTVTTVATFNPKDNTTCTGLYRSNMDYCTQCESHGFRRIAYSIDRPDVMSLFTTRIEADKTHFPQLLANGNPVSKGDLRDGRHYVTW